MEVELVTLPARQLLTIRAQVAPGELGTFLPAAFAELADALGPEVAHPAASRFAWYHSRPGTTTDVSACIPTGVGAPTPVGRTATATFRGGPALVTTHRGAYACLPHVWRRLEDERVARGLEARGDLVEEYLSEPAPGGDAAAATTRLVLPVLHG